MHSRQFGFAPGNWWANESLVKEAEKKGEAGIQNQAAGLKAALDAKDRKAVGAAASNLEKAVKDVKDKDVEKMTGKLAKDIKGDAGATIGKVLSGDNLLKALYLFIHIGG